VAESSAKTILIIDDDKGIRDLAQSILERYDYRVLTASDSIDGFKIMEAHRPDLILLDVHLEKEDGLVLLSRLKANAMFKSVPVIMLTGDAGRDLVARAVRAGAIDYIVKPFRKDILVGRIVRAMQLGDLERARESSSAARVDLERKGGITRLLFIGKMDNTTLQRLAEVFTAGMKIQTKNDEIVLDLRFQTIQGPGPIVVLRAIFDFLKPLVPRIIAGRNYRALLDLDITFEEQLFLSPDDLVQWLRFRESGRKKVP